MREAHKSARSAQKVRDQTIPKRPVFLAYDATSALALNCVAPWVDKTRSANRALVVSSAREGTIGATHAMGIRLQRRTEAPAFLALWALFAPMVWMPALLVQVILSTQVGVVIV